MIIAWDNCFYFLTKIALDLYQLWLQHHLPVLTSPLARVQGQLSPIQFRAWESKKKP